MNGGYRRPRAARKRAWPFNHLGFTLVETLVVLAVVSFAAGITLPRAIEEARDKRSKADLRTMTIALNIYYQDHGTYPLYLQELTDDHLIMSDFAYRNASGRYYFYAVHFDVQGEDGGPAAERLDHYVLGDPGPNPAVRYDNRDWSATLAALASGSTGLPEGLDPAGYTTLNGSRPRAFVWGRNPGRPGPVRVNFNAGDRSYENVDVVWLQDQPLKHPKLSHD